MSAYLPPQPASSPSRRPDEVDDSAVSHQASQLGQLVDAAHQDPIRAGGKPSGIALDDPSDQERLDRRLLALHEERLSGIDSNRPGHVSWSRSPA